MSSRHREGLILFERRQHSSPAPRLVHLNLPDLRVYMCVFAYVSLSRTSRCQYLDGISVTRDVLEEPNPLLVVNGRVNLAKGAVDSLPTGQRIATIEANHMVGTGRVSVRTGL